MAFVGVLADVEWPRRTGHSETVQCVKVHAVLAAVVDVRVVVQIRVTHARAERARVGQIVGPHFGFVDRWRNGRTLLRVLVYGVVVLLFEHHIASILAAGFLCARMCCKTKQTLSVFILVGCLVEWPECDNTERPRQT